jgi:hypothetical protein
MGNFNCAAQSNFMHASPNQSQLQRYKNDQKKGMQNIAQQKENV